MKLRKWLFLSLMVASALVLSVAESMISVTVFIIPGVKLGLANVITLIVLYRYGPKEALVVVLCRIFLSMLFPVVTIISFALSLSGGLLALGVMALAKRFTRFSIVGVSVLGSLFHMVGQILAAMLILSTTTLLFYLPTMMLLAIPTGIVTGLIAKKLYDVLTKHLEAKEE